MHWFIPWFAPGHYRPDAGHLVVLDGLLAEGERAQLLDWVTAPGHDHAGPPPGDKWEMACVDRMGECRGWVGGWVAGWGGGALREGSGLAYKRWRPWDPKAQGRHARCPAPVIRRYGASAHTPTQQGQCIRPQTYCDVICMLLATDPQPPAPTARRPCHVGSAATRAGGVTGRSAAARRGVAEPLGGAVPGVRHRAHARRADLGRAAGAGTAYRHSTAEHGGCPGIAVLAGKRGPKHGAWHTGGWRARVPVSAIRALYRYQQHWVWGTLSAWIYAAFKRAVPPPKRTPFHTVLLITVTTTRRTTTTAPRPPP